MSVIFQSFFFMAGRNFCTVQDSSSRWSKKIYLQCNVLPFRMLADCPKFIRVCSFVAHDRHPTV